MSHHPPVTALFAESFRGWKFFEEYRASSKFRGTLKIEPSGLGIVEFPKHGEYYSFGKPITVVHNLVIGKMWSDQDRDVVISNQKTKEKCVVFWSKYHASSKEHLLTMKIHDSEGLIQFTVHGCLHQIFVLLSGDVTKEKLPSIDKIVSNLASFHVIWKITTPPEFSKDYYGMTTFAIQLNEMMPNICSTDSRWRPDQRLIEEGDFEGAAKEKNRLEEKQRSEVLRKESSGIAYRSRWFHAEERTTTTRPANLYSGGYWDEKAVGFEQKKIY